MTGSDPDWASSDESRLHAVRRGLDELDEADDLRRLEEAVAAALRKTLAAEASAQDGSLAADRNRLWERLEQSLDAEEPGQDAEDNTPGK